MPELGISHVIVKFCTTGVVQNMEITWENCGPTCTCTACASCFNQTILPQNLSCSLHKHFFSQQLFLTCWITTFLLEMIQVPWALFGDELHTTYEMMHQVCIFSVFSSFNMLIWYLLPDQDYFELVTLLVSMLAGGRELTTKSSFRTYLRGTQLFWTDSTFSIRRSHLVDDI